MYTQMVFELTDNCSFSIKFDRKYSKDEAEFELEKLRKVLNLADRGSIITLGTHAFNINHLIHVSFE